MNNSTPSLTEFNPHIIPVQFDVIKQVRRDFDYEKDGVLEVLLSGSYGSAKSILMAHLVVTHVTMFNRARCCLCRKAMPDLKDTILTKILEHMEGVYIEGEHYDYNKSGSPRLTFWTESEIICRSWSDKKYGKFKSLELSMAAIEELTENSNEEFLEFYTKLVPRVGRLKHVPESFVISATNPDSPAHAAYDWFFKNNPNRKVFLSRTSDNPFLPDTYISQLMQTLTSQEIRRYVYGEWVEITSEVIYYAYNSKVSGVLQNYKIDYSYPVYLSWDFNIGHNKPMSMVMSQYIKGNFFFFDEVVIHSARTLDVLEEINARGYFDLPITFIIHGDATGRRRDTRSIHSDYEVITKYLSNLVGVYGHIKFEVDVGLSNPPIRTRHSLVNGKLMNAFNQTSVYLDMNKCKNLDKGLKLTMLKKGGSYIEDDSLEFQHVTTAMGYHICRILGNEKLDKGFIKTKIN